MQVLFASASDLGQVFPVTDRTDADARDLDALTWASRWSIHPVDREAFLALPPDKRALAIARIDVLQELTTQNPPPSRADRQAAAARLSISVPRLQGLMRAWKREKSLSVVVPYLSRRPHTRSHHPGHQIARRIIQKAIAQRPDIAEPSVSRRIAAICERLGVKPPARMTIRGLLDEARRELPPPSLIFPFDADPEEEICVRSAGDSLVLSEHYFEAAIEGKEGKRLFARALLLFDVFTGFILGVAEDLDIVTLARNVRATLLEEPYRVGPWRLPSALLLGPDLQTRETERLRAHARNLGIAADVVLRRQISRWSEVVLWPGFERLRPTARPIRRKGPADDWPQLSPEEFAYLLNRAVSKQRSAKEERFSREPGSKTGGEEELASTLTDLLEGKA